MKSVNATISGNIVKGNSASWYTWLYGSQILISASSNVQVYDNIVETASSGGHGITVLQQSRGTAAYGPYLAQGNYVHNNKITYLYEFGKDGPPLSGVGTDVESRTFWATYGSTNRFDYNNYHVPDLTARHWAWRDKLLDWNGIKNEGQELNGTIDADITRDTSPFRVPTCSDESQRHATAR